ncbi:MAG: glucosaminidase domain-containing protein, partial [Alicyclobacillus sp.]|nr:glucosaminidase domain-containing protein [Alicyclobacillus sp.]
VYGWDGSLLGSYDSLSDAKSAVIGLPGGSVVDSSGRLAYAQPVPFAAFAADGTPLGVYRSVAEGQAAVANYPGATVVDAAGDVLYTQSSTAGYSAYTADGSLIGTYPRLSDAEAALSNHPGGTVTNSSGKVLFTASAPPAYSAYGADGQLVGTYGQLADAAGALSGSPGGVVKDSAGNILYVQPLNVFTAFAADGAILGLFPTLSAAQQALASQTGGTVRNPSGQVVYTAPGSSAGGSGSNGTGSGGGSSAGGPSQGGSNGGGGATAGPSFNQADLRFAAPNNITAAVIDQYLSAHNSPLTGLGRTFIEAQNTYGVNANYLVSHAILETGWGKSQIALAKNNLFGYGAFDANPGEDAGMFPSVEYAILFQAWEVRQNYLTPGARLYVSPTLDGMNVHYATDPHWADSIASLMGQLAAYVDDSVDSYPQYAPNQQVPAPSATAEPAFRLNGAQGTVQQVPGYGGLPYYSQWTYGSSHMFVRTLQTGTAGGDVATLQQALNQADHAGLQVDGVYGPLTAAAVKKYQAEAGLPATGTCDYKTWKSLIPAPTGLLAPGTKVAIDQMMQGLAGGLVMEWYHIPGYGWVDSQFIQLNNVYRLTVPDPKSPSDVNVPVYSPGHPGTVLTTMHAGDFVVAKSPAPVNGYFTVQFADQDSGQALTGWVKAAQATLTQVR